ncbi:hypothetical protein XM38_044210 [Halomicronema hongdechloris C2206]|uniref:Uncharacterized protein n=1 Tax=Halomicronema hongdechloris C2206 TaxID=1641165 RepID=A0A1Z3HT31_9CYAN|nr:hypothetical protein [Halomicronema hongdechloris]ASC73454.1 hypothetical protein XM38_044210 [Halomicronema hongdechloris C2206]
MSDTSAFIAGCATTGAAALMLLLARMSLDETSPRPATESEPYINEAITPIPAPPPPTVDTPDTNPLEQELEQQQELIQRLETQLGEQQQQIDDLEEQLRRQEDDARTLLARLDDYQHSVDSLASQQNRLEGAQQTAGQTQTSLVWVGAGIVMIVLLGGAALMVVIVVFVASRRRESRASQAPMYPVNVPPTAYHPYYQQELITPYPLRPSPMGTPPSDYPR